MTQLQGDGKEEKPPRPSQGSAGSGYSSFSQLLMKRWPLLLTHAFQMTVAGFCLTLFYSVTTFVLYRTAHWDGKGVTQGGTAMM